jgi:hypothetical protein
LAKLAALAKSVHADIDRNEALLDGEASPSSSHRARVTILMHGQTARPHCGNKARQWEAVESQHKGLFEPLASRGFDVNLLLATNHCGSETTASGGVSWESQLREHYGPVMTDVLLDNCHDARERRCLIHRVLLLWDRQLKEDAGGLSSPGGLGGSRRVHIHDRVLFTRPDMLYKARGREMVLAMVAGSPNRITWPFKCEDDAWKSWRCVADTLVALPAAALAAYRGACLGHVGCHPEAHQGGGAQHMLRFDHGGGGHVAGGYSGHACYRCAELAVMRFRESRLSELKGGPFATAAAGSAKPPPPSPLLDQVWFGVDLVGGDYRALNLKDHPAYATAVAAAVRATEGGVEATAEAAPLAVAAARAAAAARVAAAQWQPAAAAAACEAACKEAAGCRAWSAGAGAHVLEVGLSSDAREKGEAEIGQRSFLNSGEEFDESSSHDRPSEVWPQAEKAVAVARLAQPAAGEWRVAEGSDELLGRRGLALDTSAPAAPGPAGGGCKYVAWKKKMDCPGGLTPLRAGLLGKAAAALEKASKGGADFIASVRLPPHQQGRAAGAASEADSVNDSQKTRERARAATAFAARLERLGASGPGAFCVLKNYFVPPPPLASSAENGGLGESSSGSSSRGVGGGIRETSTRRVVSGALGAASVGAGPLAVLGSLQLGFAWDVEMRVNARLSSGNNPFYTFASEHDYSNRPGGGRGGAATSNHPHGAAHALHHWGANGNKDANNADGSHDKDTGNHHLRNGPAIPAGATVGGMFIRQKKNPEAEGVDMGVEVAKEGEDAAPTPVPEFRT